ncbi:hypothetical protein DCM91_08950 [Chitinophaga costaii]|nr:hypothetical protein DCM91_08950 [Chitinophaga costaii]
MVWIIFSAKVRNKRIPFSLIHILTPLAAVFPGGEPLQGRVMGDTLKVFLLPPHKEWHARKH